MREVKNETFKYDIEQDTKGFRPKHFGQGSSRDPLKSKLEEKVSNNTDRKVTAPLDKWEAVDFFNDLEKIFERLKAPVSNERTIIFLGLRYLNMEAKSDRFSRNQTTILMAWRLIKPHLDYFQLLEKYKGARILSKKIQNFLTGKT